MLAERMQNGYFLLQGHCRATGIDKPEEHGGRTPGKSFMQQKIFVSRAEQNAKSQRVP